MSYRSVLTCAAVVCAVVGLTAQSTQPQTGSSASASAPSSADKVMITGCVARMEPPAGGAAAESTAGRAGETTRFVLNNAMRSTGATGTTGSTSASIASMYRLEGEDSQLTPHVGHKVEITGTAQSRATASASSSAGGASASVSSTAAPLLKVESVKMISTSCTP